jgi:hypothetical protein
MASQLQNSFILSLKKRFVLIEDRSEKEGIIRLITNVGVFILSGDNALCEDGKNLNIHNEDNYKKYIEEMVIKKRRLNAKNRVKDSFERCCVILYSINLETDIGGFGNYVFSIKSNRGNFKIISDRGQVFLEGIESQKLQPIYEKGKWSLDDLLNAIK